MRSVCAHLGLSIDVNLPTECDDEYWTTPDGEPLFKQPPDKPSKISAFNCYIRLTQIMALAHRTIVGARHILLYYANVMSHIVRCKHPYGTAGYRRTRMEVTHSNRTRLRPEQVGRLTP